ncbi:MAG: O-antigen ligase family protein [Oligoflexia bacterium]|nr:O-antigen ligase family protein [Oligoflexia bacterium]
MKDILLKLTYASLFVLALGTFTSVSISAVSHILLIIPGIYFFKSTKDKKYSWSYKYLFLMILTIILSVIFNWSDMERPVKNLMKIKYFVIPMLGVYATQKLNDVFLKDKSRRILFYTFLLSTSIATISGLIALKSGFNPLKMKAACHPTRACGLYGMYMTYGYGISLFSVLVWSLILSKHYIVNKYALWTSALLGLIGTIFSYARGGWIGLAAGIGAFLFKKNIKMAIIACVIGVATFGIAIKYNDKVNDMFLKRSGSNQQRIAFYQAAWYAFKEKPVFGWGYRNFEPNVSKIKKQYSIPYESYGGHAHNNLLEHLASTGFIGFIVTLLFFGSWLFEMYRRFDLIGWIGFPFVSSFIISGQFQYTFGDGENLFLIMGFWMITQLKLSGKSNEA